MKLLKMYARSTMVSERLNDIELMHPHQEKDPDIEEVIDLCYKDYRRLNFT